MLPLLKVLLFTALWGFIVLLFEKEDSDASPPRFSPWTPLLLLTLASLPVGHPVPWFPEPEPLQFSLPHAHPLLFALLALIGGWFLLSNPSTPGGRLLPTLAALAWLLTALILEMSLPETWFLDPTGPLPCQWGLLSHPFAFLSLLTGAVAFSFRLSSESTPPTGLRTLLAAVLVLYFLGGCAGPTLFPPLWLATGPWDLLALPIPPAWFLFKLFTMGLLARFAARIQEKFQPTGSGREQLIILCLFFALLNRIPLFR